MKNLEDILFKEVNKKFELTDNHIKLISSSYVSWNDGYNPYGVAVIDMKRPYGNSDVLEDIHYILTGNHLENDLDESTESYYIELHEETMTALQIVLSTKSFVAGQYVSTDFGFKWSKVD